MSETGAEADAVAAPDEEQVPLLVDPEVSRIKLAAELEQWRENEDAHRERGLILLAELEVEVGFCARLPITPQNDLVAMPLAVRFGFHNYDVWPPSLELIDPIERRPLIEPRLGALEFTNPIDGQPRQIFIGAHPKTGRVFLCKRGVREYHSHPEHDGDDWLLYRGGALGTLPALCDLLWRTAIRTISGVNYVSHRVRVGNAMTIGQQIALRQENVEALEQQVEAQQQGAVQVEWQGPGQPPPEILALLQQQIQQAQQGGQ